MRLKSMDGPLSMRNGNPNVINSPKRINTLQNSNITTYSTTSTEDIVDNDYVISTSAALDAYALNNINAGADKKWCIEELTHNANNQQQVKQQQQHHTQRTPRPFNINNGTLAVSLRQRGSAESSPDDSLVDYEEARSSSCTSSPQDEERAFDLSDTDDSDDGNLPLGRGGIVNPNYPGFQHLAHTLDLDYALKGSDSEEDYADSADQTANEHNNNVCDAALTNDKIDSVNRLDSVENIQKVFYDKPVFNITCDSAICADNLPHVTVDTAGEIKESISCGNIVGNFGEEIAREFGRIANDHLPPPPPPPPSYHIERAVEKELAQACEKLAIVDLQPAATKYNIEPNIEQPFVFNTATCTQPTILQDSISVKNPELTEKKEDNLSIQCAAKMAEVQTLNFQPVHVADMKAKLSDAFLSNAQDVLPIKMEVETSELDSNRHVDTVALTKMAAVEKKVLEDLEKFCKEDKTKDEKEKDEDSAVPRKKEKTETYVKKRRDYSQQIGSLISIPRREFAGRGRENLNRRSLPLSARDKKKASPELLGGFDVYNIETAMPKIDLEVIESHLRAAREEERRRRTDREEIRRRLAMGNEEDYYNGCDRPGRKPSLQARLQSGMNLQICFMNETASDTDSPSSDSECTLGNPKQAKTIRSEERSLPPPVRPATLSIGHQQPQSLPATMNETDFFAKQARLQTEARMALAQAKEMARMQMEIERQRQKKSPITEMVRHSMEKVGIPFPDDRRRLSRQILTEMNVAQLQVIVNDLHTQIEILNENLVKFLMARDDLHMEQDSMLVDIEDLTRFLGAKEQIIKEHNLGVPSNNNASPPSPAPSSPVSTMNVKPHFNRIAGLVKK